MLNSRYQKVHWNGLRPASKKKPKKERKSTSGIGKRKLGRILALFYVLRSRLELSFFLLLWECERDSNETLEERKKEKKTQKWNEEKGFLQTKKNTFLAIDFCSCFCFLSITHSFPSTSTKQRKTTTESCTHSKWK